MVNDKDINPDYYKTKKNGKECIDAMIEKFGIEKVMVYCEVIQFKYDWRKGTKRGESLEKDEAKRDWYANKQAELASYLQDTHHL